MYMRAWGQRVYNYRMEGALTLAQAMARATEAGSKYGNVKTPYNGRLYHSGKEADYARTLDQLRKARKKSERVVRVEPQVPYRLTVNGQLICKYYLDFKVTYADGRVEHIDVKGVVTDVYRLKRKLMKACHDIEIIEV